MGHQWIPSIGDVSSSNFASTQYGGPNGPGNIADGLTRSAFQIEGRPVRGRGAPVHEASRGGTVLWGNGEIVTYAINARQMADGSVRGELLFHRHGDPLEFQGTVTCVTVIGNRAYLSGDLTRVSPPFNLPHFAIALDRISSLILLPDWWPPCGYQPVPATDWTHGNAQVR